MFSHSHMFRYASLGGVVVGALFCGGCMSVDRHEPFEEITQLFSPSVEGDPDAHIDPNAVNLWPLYTQNQDVRSIAWPLIKSADEQFSLRPIYSYDRGAHDLLLGIVSADFQRDEYRIFPLWWYFPERNFAFLFPIGGYGMLGDNHYVGSPLLYNHIWSPDGEDDFKQSLLYWRSTEGKRHEQGVFPLWWYTRNEDGATEQTLFPIGSYETTAEGKLDNWHFFPLLSYYKREGEDCSSYRALLYWQENRKDSVSRELFPFYYSYANDNGDYSNGLFPLYWQSFWGDDAYVNVLGPLYNRLTVDGITRELLFPIYYRSFSQKNKALHTPFLGWGEGEEYSYFYALTAGSYTEADEHYGWLMPLYWRYHSNDEEHSEDYSFRTLLGGRSYTQSRNRTRTWLLPFSSIWEYESWATGDDPFDRMATDLLLFPLIHHVYRPECVNTPSRSKLNLGLLLYRHDFYKDNVSVFTPFVAWEYDEGRLTDFGFLLSLYKYENDVSERELKSDATFPALAHLLRSKSDAVASYTLTRRSHSLLWKLLFFTEFAKRSDSPQVNTETSVLRGLIYENRHQRISEWGDDAIHDSQEHDFHILGIKNTSSVISADHEVYEDSKVFGLLYKEVLEKDYLNETYERHTLNRRVLFSLLCGYERIYRPAADTTETSLWIPPLLYFANTSPTKTERNVLFLYSHTTKTKDDGEPSSSETSILPWGMLYNRETLTVEQGTRTKTAFLGYLYRSQRDSDGATQQHIFPFIERHTLTDGTESTSFLWRVWRREKTPTGKHRYHLFFIPFER